LCISLHDIGLQLQCNPDLVQVWVAVLLAASQGEGRIWGDKPLSQQNRYMMQSTAAALQDTHLSSRSSQTHHTLCRVLKPGGYWIHMGPLLWHWADGAWDELSIELSLADVQQAALLMGFKLTSQEFVDAAYIGERAAKG
jgi:hypothetical protein